MDDLDLIDLKAQILNNFQGINEESLQNIPESIQKILIDLNKEKRHWQIQTSSVTEDCMNIRNQLSSSKKENEVREKNEDLLTQSVNSLSSKLSASIAENREVRNRWLAEKSDLETRLYQVQALHTQYQGTLKKKEKEFDRLQIQLSKLVKDSNRGVKSCITISQPLKKNLSQDKEKPITLRDAELHTLKCTVNELDIENKELRETLEQVQDNMIELQEKFENALLVCALRPSVHTSSGPPVMKEVQTMVSPVADRVNSSLDPHRSLQKDETAVSLPTVSSTDPSSISKEIPSLLSPTPSSHTPRTLPIRTPNTSIKRILLGTPRARPVRWLVQQVHTEVKKLRDRVEGIMESKATTQWDPLSALHLYSQDPSSNPTGFEEYRRLRESMNASEYEWSLYCKHLSMTSQLMASMQVIKEQDKLIHDALVGSFAGLHVDPRLNSIQSTDEDIEEEETVLFKMNESDLTTSNPMEGRGLPPPVVSSVLLNESDILPPASPETMELLIRCGWTTLPPLKCDAEKGEAGKGLDVEDKENQAYPANLSKEKENNSNLMNKMKSANLCEYLSFN